MHIHSISLKGYRNFSAAIVQTHQNSLIVGANDVGKTNLIHALRILLDKTLSDFEIEPTELDFHISKDGSQADEIEILIEFRDVTQDAVISQLKGYVSDDAKTFLKYAAKRSDLSYKLYAGYDRERLEEIPSRFYLKHLNLRYVKSQRDLQKYIQSEKRHLLKLASEKRTKEEQEADKETLKNVGSFLSEINTNIRRLHYVASATNDINAELKSLAHHNSDYSVHLNTGDIEVNQFIEKLELGANANGGGVMLGGDGRNNQILLALWKAKSLSEYDVENEVVIYCIEEPEAHLHPHQQRKLASYLIEKLPGQSIVTTHSPQITANYKPNSIIRLRHSVGSTVAASQGCSECISDAWDGMGYRMSILPAEAFFSNAVLLVEGPSEKLLYTQLAQELDIDLDFYNISILCVDGVQFKVYIKILDAMEIPWVVRTDNDISDIIINKGKPNEESKRNLAGINRCLDLAEEPLLPHKSPPYLHQHSLDDGTWQATSAAINSKNVFLAKIDLEHDLGDELPIELIQFHGPSVQASIDYLQSHKAIRMREFLKQHSKSLSTLAEGELVKPLYVTVALSIGER